MKFSTWGLMAGLAATAASEDVLFVDKFQFDEFTEATVGLGLTAKVVTEAQWSAMTTEEFASYKAIVLADPDCSRDPTILKFLDDTKKTWSPAVLGNMILIGTDPTYHFSAQPGAKKVIDNGIKFAAAGVSKSGAHQTGLYFALSCYWDQINTADVTVLSEFGEFGVRGNLACYNKAHKVADSPALVGLDDKALSNWDCSVHEAFSKYPSVGINGFQALAIAQDIVGEGSQTFGDKTIGLPYIISRGATPAGCGDGNFDPELGEECDDHNTKNGDGCSASCKCESGRPKGDGTCLPPLVSSSSTSSKPTPYGNHTVTDTATSTLCPTPYVTPTVPYGPKIVGVEIIVVITIIEDCHTVGGTTYTSYVSSACSTIKKPIWDGPKTGYPCYVCEKSCPTGTFITAYTTSYVNPGPTYVPKPPVLKGCSTCSEVTLTTCPVYETLPASSVYAVPVVTYGPHTHIPYVTPSAPVYPVPTLTPVATGGYTPVKSSSPVFTGAANKMNVGGAVAGLVGLAALAL